MEITVHNTEHDTPAPDPLTDAEVDEIARRIELMGLRRLAEGFRDPRLRAAAGDELLDGFRVLLAVDEIALPTVLDFLEDLPNWEEIPPRIWSDHHTDGGPWCRWSGCAVASHLPDDAACANGCEASAVIDNPELDR